MTTGSPAFELERFRWSGPDRLEVAGRFAGLGDEVKDAVLVVRGPAGAQKLTAVPGSVWDGPADGGRWHARFAWPSAPTAFDAAELRIGDALVVELPDPPGRRRSLASRHLEVKQRAPDEDAAEAAAPESPPDVPTAQLRLQAQLLVAREEARELRGELERAREDLAATRTALESERERHAADAKQFRLDLAEVQASAEEAVAGAQAAAEEAVATATGRVAELEAAAGEMDTLRAQADEHERLRTAVGEARAALEAALDRLPAAPGE